jgi:hypothetical protein
MKTIQQLEQEASHLQAKLKEVRDEIISFRGRFQINWGSKETREQLDMLRPYLMKRALEIWRYNHQDISRDNDWWNSLALSSECTAQLYLIEYFGTDTWDINFYRNEDDESAQQISVYPVYNGVCKNDWESCIRL